MSTAYIAGIVCGVLVVALVCWLVLHINKKTGVEKKEYDERQQAIRDKGFRFAYLSLIGYMAVFAFLYSLDIIRGEMSGWLLIGVILSLLVHIVYSIYMDAYFRVSDSPKSYIILFAVLGAINILLEQYASLRMIIYALLLIGMMVLRPSGILGNYEFSFERRKKYESIED